jgi:hypothetical protein
MEHPPIIGYTRAKWTNPLWVLLARVVNWPTRWMSCSSYEECEVEWRPGLWVEAKIDQPKPIFDPTWHRVRLLRGSGVPGVYRAVGLRWVEIPDFDETVRGVDFNGVVIRHR